MGKAIILENLSFRQYNIGRVTIRRNVPVLGISILNDAEFSGMYLQMRVAYTPADTTHTGVTWSILSGSEYASINASGLLTVDSSADNALVTVKAVSTDDSSLVATKQMTLTYVHQSDYITSIGIVGSASVLGKQATYTVEYNPADTYLIGVDWSVESGGDYASITNNGILSIKEGASANEVVIKATSIYDNNVYATKTITVTYLDAIPFADPAVKAICVANWDTNGDGELTYTEAEAVTSIASQFQGNTNIVSFDEFRFFKNLTTVAKSGRIFKGCTSLRSIIMPPNLTDLMVTYGEFFMNCTSLQSIDLSNVIDLGSSCCEGCTGLEEVILNESMATIPNRAFYECTSLTSVSLPSQITSIGTSAFYGCSSLVSLTLPNSIATLGKEVFNGCVNLELAALPPLLTSIEQSAFRSCKKITVSSVPSGVTTIASYAFFGCTSITETTLPAGITSIGSQAFRLCSAMTKMIILAETPPTLGSSAFGDNSCLFYVPDSAVETYKAADGWTGFASRIHSINELSS